MACLASLVNSFQTARADCVSPPSGLVGWWPGDGNANDLAGGNNGTLMGGAYTSPSCAVGQSFQFDTANAAVFIPASPQLNAGQGSGFTIETWICPSDVSQGLPIAEWNNGTSFFTHFWISVPVAFNGGGPGCLFANIVDTGGTHHVFHSAPGLVKANQPQHVALTFNKSSGTAKFFLNGQAVAQSSLGNFTPQTGFDFYIGHRPPGPSFNGSIDELSIYNRDLSTNEIVAIYAAGSYGKCTAGPETLGQPQNQLGFIAGTATFSVTARGTAPLSYQWEMGTNLLAGATNATLTLTNLQSSDAGDYSVVVSNGSSSVTSNPANLSVNLAGVSIAMYPGVKVDGVIGQTYGIQSTTDLNNTNSWAGRTNLTLLATPIYWFDYPTPPPKTFYRVVPGPISIP